MAVDVGDTIALTWPDMPRAVTTATLTITLPDGTSSSRTVAGSGGTATFNYPIVQSGRHAVRWSGGGQAYSDAFDATDADPGYVISLDDAKQQLRISGTNSDDKLRLYIEAASGVVEFYRGDMIRRVYTESYDGGDQAIYVRHTPLQAVTALTEYVGNIAYTLTLQPPGASINAWGYSIEDPASGRIVRRTATGQPFRFVPGVGNISVTYTTGLPVIPAAVRLAASMIVQHLWRSQRGADPLPMSPSENESTVPGVNYAIPLEAIELLETAPRNPVIA